MYFYPIFTEEIQTYEKESKMRCCNLMMKKSDNSYDIQACPALREIIGSIGVGSTTWNSKSILETYKPFKHRFRAHPPSQNALLKRIPVYTYSGTDNKGERKHLKLPMESNFVYRTISRPRNLTCSSLYHFVKSVE